MTDYRSKYMKYENKYLKLKKIERSLLRRDSMTGGGNTEGQVYLFKRMVWTFMHLNQYGMN